MNYLILVNKFEPLPAGFTDEIKLKDVCGRLFESQTAECLEMMLYAASSDGIDIGVLSGYRSEEYQQMLWEREISREMGKGLSYNEATSLVSRTLALPGCGEHSTGLAADLCTPSADDTEVFFYKTEQGKWLCRHAQEYGFILRYPRMKEHLTGIDYEPWHYRYVGQEAARLITESGICLEEFLHFYSDKYTTC